MKSSQGVAGLPEAALIAAWVGRPMVPGTPLATFVEISASILEHRGAIDPAVTNVPARHRLTGTATEE